MALKKVVKGLTPETAKVFDKISKLNCINDLWLCGGTSISLQLNHRLSEDLDFELLGTNRERPSLSFDGIISETESLFPGTSREILGDDHFQLFLPNNVKLSFFRPENAVPYLNMGFKHNNLKTPSLQDLLGQKLYTTTVRHTYRDYYDIFCLLESGCSFTEGLRYALALSRHTVHTKQLLSTLTTPQLFPKDDNFNAKLHPKHNIDADEIAERIKLELPLLKNLHKTALLEQSDNTVVEKQTCITKGRQR